MMAPVAGSVASTTPEPTVDQPFVIFGTLHDETQTIQVASLPALLATIGAWSAVDPGATGTWWLSRDYSAPLVVLARAKRDRFGNANGRRICAVWSPVFRSDAV
jgi:hypothetical protein